MDECDFIENAVDSSVVAGTSEDVDIAFYGVDILPMAGKSESDCITACSAEDINDGGFF